MHILLLQGTADGAPVPRALHLTTVVNQSQFGSLRLDYVALRQLNLTRVVNAQSFGAAVLNHVVVRNLNVTQVVNASVINDAHLAAIVFEPVNAETVALIAQFDQSYLTTEKRQMDTLITELKNAGVWSGLDWYGNAFWAKSEHDALLDWTNPTRSLTRIGSASWAQSIGLSGVNPAIASGRYASGWDVGDGPHSTNTNLAMFCKITAIDVPQNGMLPMGCWKLSSPGPATPIGSVISLSVLAGTGFAQAYSTNGQANNFGSVGDGLGVWGTSLGGGVNKTFKNGVELDSDSVITVLAGGTMHVDGLCVVGSTGSSGTTRSFPGTEIYWGWGAAMDAAKFAAVESAFQAALLPPGVDAIVGAILIDGDNNYLVDENDDYIIEDGP